MTVAAVLAGFAALPTADPKAAADLLDVDDGQVLHRMEVAEIRYERHGVLAGVHRVGDQSKTGLAAHDGGNGIGEDAVIVAVPTCAPVTTPLLDTVATDVLLELGGGASV